MTCDPARDSRNTNTTDKIYTLETALNKVGLIKTCLIYTNRNVIDFHVKMLEPDILEEVI